MTLTHLGQRLLASHQAIVLSRLHPLRQTSLVDPTQCVGKLLLVERIEDYSWTVSNLMDVDLGVE